VFLDEFSLKGKRAIVTGEPGELSESAALALVEAGAIVGMTEDTGPICRIHKLAKESENRLISLPARGTGSRQVRAMVVEALAKVGSIDILVNVTPEVFAKPLLSTKVWEWQHAMERIVKPTFLCCQAVGKNMTERGSGRIINVISALALTSMANSAVCSASMGAIKQLTAALAVEWACFGVRTNAIAIGWFVGNLQGIDQEERSRLSRYIPLKRYGMASELGGVLVYLASDASDFVNGHTVTLDGGLSIHP